MAMSEGEASAAEQQALNALRDTLKALGLDQDDGGTIALAVGMDCILSVSETFGPPSQVLLGAISTLLKTAISKGWLPPVPPGAQMVLILDSVGGAAVDTVLH